MDAIIETLQNSSSTTQAIGVSIGGLIGVFATLAFFFLLIVVADRISKH